MHNFELCQERTAKLKPNSYQVVKPIKAKAKAKPRITEIMLKIHMLRNKKIPYRQKLVELDITGKEYQQTVKKMNDINLSRYF